MTTYEILIVPDPPAVAHQAARTFMGLAQEAVESRGRFSAVLSGGSTPGALYRLLAGEPYVHQIPWAATHLFWDDERWVPPDDPDSNYRLANEALLSRIPIPPENVHRMEGELETRAAAQAYHRELQRFFCGTYPRFDLVLLGLGEDGHTASLFPGSPILVERERLAAEVTAFYGGRPAQRVTLTPVALNTARHVLFLVTGSAKAAIVQQVLEGPADQFPAQRIQPTAGHLTWLMDETAASRLSEGSSPVAV